MLPEGWNDYRLKDLIKSLDAGVSVNSLDDSDVNSNHKILKTSCVSAGVFDPTKTKSVTDPIEIARLSEPVLRDSIIISRMNTPVLVGANGYVSEAIPNTYLPDRLWQVKPKHQAVHMHWLGFWFSLEHTRHLLRSNATGTSGSMKNITKSDVLNLPIVVPPLPEQKKIAQILSTWDNAISATERLLENSQQRKKALMQQLLTGKKRLLDKNGLRFSGEWESKPLSDIAEVYQPKTISQSMLTETGYPVYGANGIIGFYEEFNHANEQIAVTCRGSTCGVVNWTQAQSWITGNAMVINTDNFPDIRKKFLFYVLDGSNLSYLISGSGQPQITGSIKAHTVKTPALEEQQKIAAVLSTADQEISALQQKLEALKQEKKALMQQLLTGKRRVQVDDAA